MPSPHAGDHTGRCLQSNIRPWQQSKGRLLDILKSKWPTLNLSSLDLDESDHTDLEPVDIYKRKAKGVFDICAQMKTVTHAEMIMMNC